MSIWFVRPSEDQWRQVLKGTFSEYVGITKLDYLDDRIRGELIVDERNLQGYGMLHGGVASTFADSLVGHAANCTVEYGKFFVVTIDMNISYIRPGWPGVLIGEAWPIHMGKSTQIWAVEVKNEEGKLQSVSRLTMGVVPVTEAMKGN